MGSGWVSRVRRFVADEPGLERCDVCAAPLGALHAHLLERSSRGVLCVCASCLVSRIGAAGEDYRLVAPRAERLERFRLAEPLWDMLQLPIDLAFLLRRNGQPIALCPSPAGVMERALSDEAWAMLVAANPVVDEMAPDVEALLVDRTRGARDAYRVSIDRCYALIGLMRARWEGISGGRAVFEEIDRFLAALKSGESAGYHG
jgi:hypothetical protein